MLYMCLYMCLAFILIIRAILPSKYKKRNTSRQMNNNILTFNALKYIFLNTEKCKYCLNHTYSPALKKVCTQFQVNYDFVLNFI